MKFEKIFSKMFQHFIVAFRWMKILKISCFLKNLSYNRWYNYFKIRYSNIRLFYQILFLKLKYFKIYKNLLIIYLVIEQTYSYEYKLLILKMDVEQSFWRFLSFCFLLGSPIYIKSSL